MEEIKREPVKKGDGFNLSERYLTNLCEKSFLSLWSYPNVFRSPQKELCDLLVIFGDDIILFSDKWCEFPNTNDINLDWERWFRRAVKKSAEQIWGAESWLRKYPTKVFLEATCSKKMPFPLEINAKTKFHLVLVAHGASKRCKEEFGGSGSMIFRTDIKGTENHKAPFTIGDLNPNKTFVHVLDDTTLDILMSTRDTIADFTDYLTKKEKLLRSGIEVFSTGEEEMLANYLKNVNSSDEHDFVLPDDKKLTGIAYMEGDWESFKKNPQRLAQIEADKISYVWDNLIEEFNKHALQGTQYKVSEGGISDTEKCVRFLAREPRFMRRMLAKSLVDIMDKTPKDQRMIRLCPPFHLDKNAPHYVFLLFPAHKEWSKYPYDEYRKMRGYFLESVCLITRLKYPDAKHVVGICTESGRNNYDGGSEDLLYFDCNGWCDELEKRAKKDQKELQILVAPIETKMHVVEYPDVEIKTGKNPRNKKCPCGSEKKYKKCHG